jgi:hypothetical protein
LVLRISDGELGAGYKAGAKSEEEKNAREIEGLERRGRRYSHIARLKKCCGAPIDVDWNGRWRIFRERVAHEAAGEINKFNTNQYSTSEWVRASFESRRK